MTDVVAQGTLTLEEVRTRFLAAEAHLGQASRSLDELQNAITSVGEARAGLREAGTEIGRLGGLFQTSIDTLTQNLATLREGVDALKNGDSAHVLRQIAALDQAVHAGQSALLERMTFLVQRIDAGAAQQRAVGEEQLRALGAVQQATDAGFGSIQNALGLLRSEVVETRNTQGHALTTLDARSQGMDAALKARDESQAKRQAELKREVVDARREWRLLFAVTLVVLIAVAAIAWFK